MSLRNEIARRLKGTRDFTPSKRKGLPHHDNIMRNLTISPVILWPKSRMYPGALRSFRKLNPHLFFAIATCTIG